MSGYGGMSMSNSKNQSLNQGQFDQSIWATQVPALQAMWNSALGQFNRANQRYNKQMNTAVGQNNQVMGIANPALQSQLGGGAYANIDANRLQDQIYSSMQQPTNTQEINNMIMGGKGNNYADAMKGQYVQDANIATQNMLNNLDARASVAGLPGSSRQSITAAQGIGDINRNLQRNLAETGYNTFDKDLERKLAIAGQADQANLSRQGMLGDMLAGKQGAMSGGMQMAPTIGQMGGFNTGQAAGLMGLLQGLKGVIGDPTVLNSGSTYGSSLGRANAFGMQAGGGVMGGGGGGNGGGGISVICTEFYNQGYMPEDIYALDELFGESIRLNTPHIYDGYMSWAPYIVSMMQKSPMLTHLLWALGKPWSEEMAYEMGQGESNPVGKVLMKVGLSICSLIGKGRRYENVPC